MCGIVGNAVRPGAVGAGERFDPKAVIEQLRHRGPDAQGDYAHGQVWMGHTRLSIIDLTTGDLVWRVPLGEYPQLVAKGVRNTGTMNYRVVGRLYVTTPYGRYRSPYDRAGMFNAISAIPR